MPETNLFHMYKKYIMFKMCAFIQIYILTYPRLLTNEEHIVKF